MTSEKFGRFVGILLAGCVVGLALTLLAVIGWSFVSWRLPYPENLNFSVLRFIFASGFMFPVVIAGVEDVFE